MRIRFAVAATVLARVPALACRPASGEGSDTSATDSLVRFDCTSPDAYQIPLSRYAASVENTP